MIRGLLENQRDLKKTAIFDGNIEYSYGELLKTAQSIRSFLPCENKERVAILLPNGGDFIAALWSVIMSGLTAFPLNILLTHGEILPLINQASVKAVITSSRFAHIFEGLENATAQQVKVIYADKININEITAVTPILKTAKADSDDPMLLLCTSGTTDKAKIVQLSERNVETAVLGYLDKLCFEKDTRYILAVPFSSVYGMMIISAALMRSFPLITLNGAFTLDAFYQAVEMHKATHYEGSTTAIFMMEKMAGRAIEYNIDSLKYVGFGGSKVTGATVERLLAFYPDKEFFQGYGMTEAAPLISKHPQKKLKKTDSVGSAIIGVEIAIESDGKSYHSPNVTGEIIVRGANVMLGYLDNPVATNQTVKNGYLHTGDIGYLDEDGYLYICGRKKNMIIVCGFNVYPEEVEAFLQNSLLCANCRVYGESDSFGNETLCADIVPMNPDITVSEIKAYCKGRLADYKIPQKIIFYDTVAQTATGKVKRHNG